MLKQGIYRSASPLCRWWLQKHGACVGLCYHRFTPSSGTDPVPGMAIDPDQFRMHLDTLSAMGSFVSVDEAASSAPLEGLQFFLTFDDGYRDNLTVLLPILEEYTIPACIYVVGGVATEELSQLAHDEPAGYTPDLLSPAEIRDLAAHPLITIGSHTMNHPRLSGLTRDEVKDELHQGQTVLADLLGSPPRHFAVPYGGAHDARWDELVDLATGEGLQSMASNFGGCNVPHRSQQEETRHLKRVSMGPIQDAWNVEGWVLTRAVAGNVKQVR